MWCMWLFWTYYAIDCANTRMNENETSYNVDTNKLLKGVKKNGLNHKEYTKHMRSAVITIVDQVSTMIVSVYLFVKMNCLKFF